METTHLEGIRHGRHEQQSLKTGLFIKHADYYEYCERRTFLIKYP